MSTKYWHAIGTKPAQVCVATGHGFLLSVSVVHVLLFVCAVVVVVFFLLSVAKTHPKGSSSLSSPLCSLRHRGTERERERWVERDESWVEQGEKEESKTKG